MPLILFSGIWSIYCAIGMLIGNVHKDACDKLNAHFSLRSWKNHLRVVRNDENKIRIYQTLCILFQEPCTETFQKFGSWVWGVLVSQRARVCNIFCRALFKSERYNNYLHVLWYTVMNSKFLEKWAKCYMRIQILICIWRGNQVSFAQADIYCLIYIAFTTSWKLPILTAKWTEGLIFW